MKITRVILALTMIVSTNPALQCMQVLPDFHKEFLDIFTIEGNKRKNVRAHLSYHMQRKLVKECGGDLACNNFLQQVRNVASWTPKTWATAEAYLLNIETALLGMTGHKGHIGKLVGKIAEQLLTHVKEFHDHLFKFSPQGFLRREMDPVRINDGWVRPEDMLDVLEAKDEQD